MIYMMSLFPLVLVHTHTYSNDLFMKHDMRFPIHLKSQYDITDHCRIGDHSTKMLVLAPGLLLISD
jgi:hypothetical protein